MLTRGDADAEPARFDWYAASVLTDADPRRMVRALASATASAPRPVHPHNGFTSAVSLYAGDRRVAAMSWGGAGHDLPHVEVSGEDSPRVASFIRETWPEHRVSRVDSCSDFDSPGAWDWIESQAVRIGNRAGVQMDTAGDWVNGQRGRTLYIGSRRSAVRARIYEKGKQLPEAGRPDWVRAEVQARPRGAAAREMASRTPSEAWGVSRWSGQLFEALTGQEAPPVRIVRWREPDGVRARRSCMQQYGPTLRAWAEEYGDDWAVLGEVIGAILGGEMEI